MMGDLQVTFIVRRSVDQSLTAMIPLNYMQLTSQNSLLLFSHFGSKQICIAHSHAFPVLAQQEFV